MSRKQTSPTPVCVLLSLIYSSPAISAETYSALGTFSTQTEQTTHSDSTSSNRGCHDKLDENNSEPLCDVQNSTDANVFDNKPILNISTQIDIRPESCLSFFDDYLHTRRGLRIESALQTASLFDTYQATVPNFPVIDFISNGHAHVVKSKDLASKIYTSSSSNSPLFESIMADAKEINDRILQPLKNQQTLSASANGESTTLRSGDVRELTLHIAIQSGMATNHQIKQIALAKIELKTRWGLTLKIIEIP